tara:strand:- start:629 stop:793 length:165 start_codon:yes stop_codon:yes gene_type:complete
MKLELFIRRSKRDSRERKGLNRSRGKLLGIYNKPGHFSAFIHTESESGQVNLLL